MRILNVELLALDLDSCDRCGGSLANLKKAVEIASPVLAALGAQVDLVETVVTSERQAQRLRFGSSPTIRIDGLDIMSTPNETVCGACSDMCGCNGGIECRVWPWQGMNHEAAPIGLIVDALLRAVVAPETHTLAPRWKGVPENLVAFFEGRKAAGSGAKVSGSGCASTGCKG
jgi:hypothetical protein